MGMMLFVMSSFMGLTVLSSFMVLTVMCSFMVLTVVISFMVLTAMTAVVPSLLVTDDLTQFRVRLVIPPLAQPQPDSPGPLVRQQLGLGHTQRQTVGQSASGISHLLILLVPGQPESLVMIFSSVP